MNTDGICRLERVEPGLPVNRRGVSLSYLQVVNAMQIDAEHGVQHQNGKALHAARLRVCVTGRTCSRRPVSKIVRSDDAACGPGVNNGFIAYCYS